MKAYAVFWKLSDTDFDDLANIINLPITKSFGCSNEMIKRDL